MYAEPFVTLYTVLSAVLVARYEVPATSCLLLMRPVPLKHWQNSVMQSAESRAGWEMKFHIRGHNFGHNSKADEASIFAGNNS